MSLRLKKHAHKILIWMKLCVVCSKFCAKGDSICIPVDYSKFDPPNDTITVVNVGIDIKDIPQGGE